MTSALIVAAGSSRRMGFQKLTASLLGKPVLRWTLEAFDNCPAIDHLVVVVSDATRELVRAWAADGMLRKPVTLSEGGAERHISVYGGLKKLPPSTELVAVHDGARPLITSDQIIRCINRAREIKAVACARPVTETLKRVDENGVITGSVDRKDTWIMETPQIFDRNLLCQAYERVMQQNLTVTDEVSAVQLLGHHVFVLENPESNLKITYPTDLLLAEQLLQARL
ncbi:2-C-methyl-D-erythritol 4-phosphate cytidylyltransferase [Phragmitibacter flavus]|uniref:2-C-methyl-D-erythritol 4-phosphate cytidylyltransferase n=1 Tax=Phragmitibacter flavus TaxID=2576071 RepID=A0A5R8KLP0_9BACT|nr:2-C-methyl-D-erythritol 4-phosphate cytidylyltransferase [Phragmitibacter flavus]TLD72669.1 2-C-methyl-D-erythritol 4-phosphate cytidylyltransferase [Phragmitibacter flavus]